MDIVSMSQLGALSLGSFAWAHLPVLRVAGFIPNVLAQPNIAQLVERSTVELADIEWSLVRFRVFGFFCFFLATWIQKRRHVC